MLIPKARGEFSEALFTAMRDPEQGFEGVHAAEVESAEDQHIALWALYELHYRGFDDANGDLEWHLEALRARARVELPFEADLRARFAPPPRERDMGRALFEYVAADDGPSLSSYIQRRAEREEALELLKEKSIFHLKESDPTAWSLPRLSTAPKASLAELLYDEYGAGNPNRLHAHLFGQGLAACGLSADYGAYIDEVSLEVLEENNAMSMLGLHRRLRAAAVGHLAAFEATSSIPSRRMAQGLSRLGFPEPIIGYYLEHVEADAVHEQLAVEGICAALVQREPELYEDVFFGAFICLDLSARFARRMLARWEVAG